MKLFSYHTLAWQFWLEKKQTSYFAICKFTNGPGWCAWCPLVSIICYDGHYLVQWRPNKALPSDGTV